jgi:hypothetical protein
MLEVLIVDEADRLKTVDMLSQLAMQEHILDIELVHRSTSRGHQVEYVANRAWFNDRGESLVKVDPLSLLEATHNPTRLESLQCAIGIDLVFKEPLARNHIGTTRLRHQCPCLVVLQGPTFIFHRVMPIRITMSSVNQGWHRWWRGDDGGGITGVRLPYAITGMGDHVVTGSCRSRDVWWHRRSGEDVAVTGTSVGFEGCSSRRVACGGTSGSGGLGHGSSGVSWATGRGVATCGAAASCCAGFRHGRRADGKSTTLGGGV